MHLAIDAVGTYGRGGAAILDALLGHASTDERFDAITVFVSHPLDLRPSPRVTLRYVDASTSARLAWALRGWQRALDKFQSDAALSFNGFSQARDQSIFIHNALYYDAARRRLDRAQQARLKIIRALTHRAAQRARSVIVQTQWMASQVERAHGVAAVIAPTVPNFVTPSARRMLVEGPDPHLLFVGSELGYKDPETFEKCVALVGGTGHMIGNFEPLKAAPGCHWYGSLPRADVLAAYRDADLLLMTSRAESLGLPLLEAMAQRLAILAVDAPYAREICGDSATYFRPGDAEDAARKIRTFEVEDPVRDSAQEARLQELQDQDSYLKLLDALCV